MDSDSPVSPLFQPDEQPDDDISDHEIVPPPTGNGLQHSPLSRIPLDIGHHRAHLFALEQPVSFDLDAWEKYWPYIDNVWTLYNRTAASAPIDPDGKPGRFWGGCRLQRNWRQPERDPNDSGRKRTRRPPGLCPAKFRVTIHADGTRVLQRSAETHSHDLDYIDGIKRCSGVRSLVADPFFAGWESGPILAYLRDPANAPASVPDLLEQAGGKFLERREVINIFSQKLRAAYPGLERGVLQRQKEKYEGVRVCNVKGCNRSFKDAKDLAKHKKDEHEFKKHDHTEKLYVCPLKTCHRHKKSKGFATMISLREHMFRMQHWGMALYHAADGVRLLDAVTESERLAVTNGVAVDARTSAAIQQDASRLRASMDHQAYSPELDFLQQNPITGTGAGPSTSADAHRASVTDASTTQQSEHQKQLMLQKLQSLQAERARVDQEMEQLKAALYAD